MIAGQDLVSANGSPKSGADLPQPFLAQFQSASQPGESPVAWLETDLNASLRFVRGLVLLTDHRLLSFPPAGEGAASNPSTWTVSPSLRLTAHDHAGLG